MALELQDIDVADALRSYRHNEPTELCRLMRRLGSDKGLSEHNYTTFYSKLFEPIRQHPVRFFELGIGTHNPNIKSHMGPGWQPGGSLRGWRDYFPRGQIFGADIDKDILFRDERIETFFCDQTDAGCVRSVFDNIVTPFDVILDDGLHEYSANVCFFENACAHVRLGGVFIIEDLQPATADQLTQKITAWGGGSAPMSDFVYRIVRIPYEGGPSNNTLLVAYRIRV